MISDGKEDVDNIFTLNNGMMKNFPHVGSSSNDTTGILDMHLDKQTYERTGLVGNPHGPKGGRGLQPRWSKETLVMRYLYADSDQAVSYDLRSPSMCHGKKGFDRLVYASKTVFPQPRSWLACNVAPTSMSYLLIRVSLRSIDLTCSIERRSMVKVLSNIRGLQSRCIGTPGHY